MQNLFESKNLPGFWKFLQNFEVILDFLQYHVEKQPRKSYFDPVGEVADNRIRGGSAARLPLCHLHQWALTLRVFGESDAGYFLHKIGYVKLGNFEVYENQILLALSALFARPWNARKFASVFFC